MHRGKTFESKKTVEECAELIQVIYGDDPDNVIDEVADVQIMIAQIAVLVGEERVEERVEQKIQQLREQLQ